jgi:excisionase family DNA binding protein
MPTPDQRKALQTVVESAQYISTSRRRIWDLLRAGQLTAVRDGKHVKIRTEELDAYIDRLPAYEPGVPA